VTERLCAPATEQEFELKNDSIANAESKATAPVDDIFETNSSGLAR
jgi:hypothetical protein